MLFGAFRHNESLAGGRRKASVSITVTLRGIDSVRGRFKIWVDDHWKADMVWWKVNIEIRKKRGGRNPKP